MESEPLLDSLRSAVTAMPDDVPLRLHLATLLLRAGQRDEAVRHLGAVLQRDPGNGTALGLLTGASTQSQSPSAERNSPPVQSRPDSVVPDVPGPDIPLPGKPAPGS